MAARVRWYRDAWWLRVRWDHNRKLDRRFGPTATDEREAKRVSERVNAALVLGSFDPRGLRDAPDRAVRLDDEFRRWHEAHRITMTTAYEKNTSGLIERHLIPHFGSRDLRELRDDDMLGFIRAKLEEGLAVAAIRNALSVLRCVSYLAIREERLVRNPA